MALFTTGTRSLILGTVVGVFVTLCLDYCIHKWDKDTLKKCIAKMGIVLVVSILMDSMLFQGMNVTRILSSFSVSEEVLEQGSPQSLEWTSSEYSVECSSHGKFILAMDRIFITAHNEGNNIPICIVGTIERGCCFLQNIYRRKSDKSN